MQIASEDAVLNTSLFINSWARAKIKFVGASCFSCRPIPLPDGSESRVRMIE